MYICTQVNILCISSVVLTFVNDFLIFVLHFRKKLLTTTQYIYQALFKEQKNSDIAIMALGKVWNLHKVYLSQSPYFYSMFNGSWKESCQDFVHIKILDERITLDGK